eukprot:TRINITY_DN123796_c0_g1_i1.p2 TRINITY_DN123796_c0_g1~~TRINITY_DN123796_c0_g1_i1.p2  ORF type:complete len:111 (+),score=27.88 TRINITY_DN123796_c0_g1_i1:65-397(+)
MASGGAASSSAAQPAAGSPAAAAAAAEQSIRLHMFRTEINIFLRKVKQNGGLESASMENLCQTFAETLCEISFELEETHHQIFSPISIEDSPAASSPASPDGGSMSGASE